MKLPILILGYERSGTTLLRRLISMHPNMPFDIVHEQSKNLFASKTKDEAIKRLTFPSKQKGVYTGGVSSLEAGQKIPYINARTAQKSIDKFNSFFGKFHIIHIVRDPIGAINSQVKTFKKNEDKCIKQYFNSVPKVTQYLKSFDNVKTISFENLLNCPLEQLKSIYNWIGDFEQNDEFLNKVITTKEPWDYQGRMLPGLRYFSSIRLVKQNLVIKNKYVRKINSLK